MAQGGSRKISFNISEQYEIADIIGEGAYGVVWYVLSAAQDDLYEAINNILT